MTTRAEKWPVMAGLQCHSIKTKNRNHSINYVKNLGYVGGYQLRCNVKESVNLRSPKSENKFVCNCRAKMAASFKVFKLPSLAEDLHLNFWNRME